MHSNDINIKNNVNAFVALGVNSCSAIHESILSVIYVEVVITLEDNGLGLQPHFSTPQPAPTMNYRHNLITTMNYRNTWCHHAIQNFTKLLINDLMQFDAVFEMRFWYRKPHMFVPAHVIANLKVNVKQCPDLTLFAHVFTHMCFPCGQWSGGFTSRSRISRHQLVATFTSVKCANLIN